MSRQIDDSTIEFQFYFGRSLELEPFPQEWLKGQKYFVYSAYIGERHCAQACTYRRLEKVRPWTFTILLAMFIKLQSLASEVPQPPHQQVAGCLLQVP